MEFIDTHTHLSDSAFRGIEEEVIGRARQEGVSLMLQPDIDASEREAMYSLTDRHRDILRPMVGLYPGSVNENWKEELDALMPYFGRSPVAVGEIGLDYHYGADTAELQKTVFRILLEMASERDLPVNIHLRDATEDFLSIIEDCRHLHLRGDLHAFSGSAEFFERVGRTGDWYVGVGGVITFKNARIASDILRIPTERILLETDSPYLTPVPHRGERNESSLIPLVAAKLSEIKGIDIDTVASITTANARELFNL